MFGAIVGAIGAIAGARSEAEAAEAQGRISKEEAKYNAEVFRNRALAIEQAGEGQTYQKLYYTRQFAAKQRLAQSGQGAMIDGDTPLLLAIEQLQLVSNDINNFRRNVAIEAAYERSGATMEEFRGDNAIYLSELKANAIRRSGMMSAFGSLAGGIDESIFG